MKNKVEAIINSFPSIKNYTYEVVFVNGHYIHLITLSICNDEYLIDIMVHGNRVEQFIKKVTNYNA